MSMKDLHNVYQVVTGWAPVAVTSTKTSSAINLANVEECQIIITPGLWTDGTHTFSLTYSGTAGGAGTYTAGVANTDYSGTLTVVSSTATAIPIQIGLLNANQYQYVKIVDTVTAATAGAIFGVQAQVKYRNVAAAP